MKNFLEAGLNDDTPTAETVPAVNRKLQELRTRRDILLKWVEAGAGTPADGDLLNKLEKQIFDLEKKTLQRV